MPTQQRSWGSFFSALVLTMCFLFPVSWGLAANPKVDINSATLEQLEAVNGIGHDTAQQILAYKQEHGPFHSLNDLLKVKGVGKVRLEALREAFTVTGGPKQHLDEVSKK